MVYQSGSGDALGNTGTFTMTDGSITKTNGGPLLLNTNDEAYFTLKNVTTSVGTSGIFLKSCKCDWGATASYGGTTHFTADDQDMEGDFVVDAYGKITAEFKNGSTLTGAIDPDNAAGTVYLTIDATSTWVVTADSYLDTLTDADATYSNITGTGKVYVNGTQIH
jgi:hypothetical protein